RKNEYNSNLRRLIARQLVPTVIQTQISFEIITTLNPLTPNPIATPTIPPTTTIQSATTTSIITIAGPTATNSFITTTLIETITTTLFLA
ncbi:6955_t:CDS:1, partial [Scutellospora calospora]